MEKDKITPIDLKSFYRESYNGSVLQKVNRNKPLPHKCTIKGQEFYYYNADLSGLMWLHDKDNRLKYNEFVEVYRKGFAEGLKHLVEVEGIERQDYNNPYQRELLTHFVYKREFIPNHKGLQDLMDKTLLRWTEENIYNEGYYNGLLHSIVTLNNELNLNIGVSQTSNDTKENKPAKPGRKPAEIKPAYTYLKFDEQSNKMFLEKLKEAFTISAPIQLALIIIALSDFEYLEVKNQKAVYTSFADFFKGECGSYSGFNAHWAKRNSNKTELLTLTKREIGRIKRKNVII